MAVGKTYHINRNSELIINMKSGEHIWAFTRMKGTYVLAADLVVLKTKPNKPSYKYGLYRAVADKQRSHYFDVHQRTDVEPVIRKIYP